MIAETLASLFNRGRGSDVSRLLKGIPLFADLSNRELQSIERIAHERSYGPGESIFREGDPGVGFYVIRRGQVRITSENPETLLGELSDGEFFGEIAILNDMARSASARAKTPCSILAFFKSDLFRAMNDNPRMGMSILSALSRIAGDRLVRANIQIESYRDRIANLESGSDPDNGTIGI